MQQQQNTIRKIVLRIFVKRKTPILFLTLTFLSLFFVVFYDYYLTISAEENSFEDYDYLDFDFERYSLSTAGCRIEKLDPWHPSLAKYFTQLKPFKCPKTAKDLLIYQSPDGSYLKVIEGKRKKLFQKNETNKIFKCTKREVYRNQWEEDDKNTFRLSDNVTEFTNATRMDVEYAEVKCFADNETIYENYFFTAIRKPEVEKACETNSRQHVRQHPACDSVPRLSVLVLGTDSVSKSNLIRRFPETLDYVVQNLSAIEMFGYNRVGRNTFPSLMPYLTGNSEKELSEGCWGGETFDNCTFLWDIFAKAGYRTAFVENFDKYNMFVYNRKGFHRRMAHYNAHTIYTPMNRKKWLKKGCWRGKADDEMVLDWVLMFQRRFHKDLFFGHFWTNIFTHNDANKAQHLDPIISSALKKMNNENLLNKTVLVFMSDHGARIGKFRETEVARQEENLPFMYLIFPEWFREQFPAVIERVRRNGHRLMTTFDLHETLKSIVNCEYSDSSSETVPHTRRGISLFQPISGQRTCENAGVPDTYCACQENVTELDVKSEVAEELSRLVLSRLNAFTEPSRNVCGVFRLENVLSVRQLGEEVYADKNARKTTRNSHVISVSVMPGGAKFEATIVEKRDEISRNLSYVVDDDVRRINLYGNSSYCVTDDAFLKTICFCV